MAEGEIHPDIAAVLAGERRWCVVTADCLDVLPTLPDGCVDAVVTDPPYAIPTMIASGRTITRSVGDLSMIETAFRVHASQWKRLVDETGRVFAFADGSSYSVMFRAMYGRFNLASLVWDKRQIGMGREFRKAHELIVHGWGADTAVVGSEGTGYADVLVYKPVHHEWRQHPAEKPVELIRSLLRVCGSFILDPFTGSGTTGVAALREGRRFIGIEIDEKYADIARKRIAAEEAQAKLFDAPEQPVEVQAELI